MSSSFFYSQDHDCPVCSPSLYPTTLISQSRMSSTWDDVSSIIDLYWDNEESTVEEEDEAITATIPMTRLGVVSRPLAIPVRQKTSSDLHSLASSASSSRSEATSHCSPSRSSSSTPLLPSSASTMTSTSSSSSSSRLSLPFSRRLRLSKRKAISNRPPRYPDDQETGLTRACSARSLDDDSGRRRTALPPTLLLPPTSRNTSSMNGEGADADYGTSKHNNDGGTIHPYNFFEASLYMSPDYSILEDGWLHLSLRSKTTESRLR